MNRVPFTLREAEIALYFSDADDAPLSEVFIGGCAERLVLDGDRAERRLEYPGLPAGQVHHADESHRIEMENLWLHDIETGAARMPVLLRNRRYIMVITWRDLERSVWAKRTYIGVTVQPNRVSPQGDEASAQTLRFAAETLYEFAGTGAVDASPALPGVVRYVDGAEVLDLFTFNPATKLFTAIDTALLTGRAAIDYSVTGEIEIRIGGTVALAAAAGVLEIGTLIAIGGTSLDVSPRLEFYRGARRVASLSKTRVLAVVSVTEQPSAPVLITSDMIEFTNGVWLFSFSGAAAYAHAFAET